MPAYEGQQTIRTLRAKLPDFTQRHPNVDIEWRLLPWNNAWSEIIRAFKAGNPPDVFQVGSTWAATMSFLGFLAKVPEGIVNRPLVAPWMKEVVSFRGEQYAVPWLVDSTCLITRRDVLEKHQLSHANLSTWDGFLAACRHIGSQTKDEDPARPLPIGWFCRPEPVTLHRLTSWLWAAGWDIPDLSQGNVQVFTQDAAMNAFAYLAQLIHTSPILPDPVRDHPARVQTDFLEAGRYAFLVSGWQEVIVKLTEQRDWSDAYDYPFDVIPLPAGPKGSVSFGGGSVLGVSPYTTHPDLAWECVRALTDDEFLMDLTLRSGLANAYQGAFWERYGDNHVVQVYQQALSTAKAYPAHALWRSVEHVLFRGASDILWSLIRREDSKTLQALTQAVDEQVNALLELGWEGD